MRRIYPVISWAFTVDTAPADLVPYCKRTVLEALHRGEGSHVWYVELVGKHKPRVIWNYDASGPLMEFARGIHAEVDSEGPPIEIAQRAVTAVASTIVDELIPQRVLELPQRVISAAYVAARKAAYKRIATEYNQILWGYIEAGSTPIHPVVLVEE